MVVVHGPSTHYTRCIMQGENTAGPSCTHCCMHGVQRSGLVAVGGRVCVCLQTCMMRLHGPPSIICEQACILEWSLAHDEAVQMQILVPQDSPRSMSFSPLSAWFAPVASWNATRDSGRSSSTSWRSGRRAAEATTAKKRQMIRVLMLAVWADAGPLSMLWREEPGNAMWR